MSFSGAELFRDELQESKLDLLLIAALGFVPACLALWHSTGRSHRVQFRLLAWTAALAGRIAPECQPVAAGRQTSADTHCSSARLAGRNQGPQL